MSEDEVIILDIQSKSPSNTLETILMDDNDSQINTNQRILSSSETTVEIVDNNEIELMEGNEEGEIKKLIDIGTLTPSHWTSVAAEMEINLLRNQTSSLRDQLDRCYEIEMHSNSYISTLKSRGRNVEQVMERIREVEAENRRLKRDLEYKFDDGVEQNVRIDFLERKLDILSEEKDELMDECSKLRNHREKSEKKLIIHEKLISNSYRQKLEEELNKIEIYFKEELRKNELCSNCFSVIHRNTNVEANTNGNEKEKPEVSLVSRVILMNPSHPSFEKLRLTSIEDLRRERTVSKDEDEDHTTIKLDERVEFTYYAEPLISTKNEPNRHEKSFKSSNSFQRKRESESSDRYYKHVSKRQKKSK